MHKNRAIGCRSSLGEAPRHACPPVENPVCTAFEEYGDVPEMLPPDFTKDDVTVVTSKLSGAAGALRAEAIEIINWILCFGCASEELRVVITRLSEWVANSSLPWATYCAMIACCLVALDKRTGVRPLGIGEMLHRALAKLVKRAATEQAKTPCGNLKLCAGLKDDMEGETHAVGQRSLERTRVRQQEGTDVGKTDKQEEGGGVVAGLNDLSIHTVGTEEEVAERF